MDFWERFSGWLTAGLMAIVAAYMRMVRNREKAIDDRLNDHQEMLTRHDKAIGQQEIHNDNIHRDLESLKASVGSIHIRINETNKTLNDKLDRLIERR